MAGIKTPIQDILAKLATLDVVNGDGQPAKLYVRIWNNQTQKRMEGKSYDYRLPAAFLEVVSPAHYETVGERIKAGDIAFRVHIEHEYYNGEGTFEQDLRIFDLRDSIDALLHGFQPTGCGLLEPLVETQNNDHENINTYEIDFIAQFIDTVAQKTYTNVVAQPNITATPVFVIPPTT